MTGRKRMSIFFTRLALLLVMLAGSFTSVSFRASAQSPAETIAYVVSDTRDEIRLVAPDGSNDRRLWLSPVDDPHNVYDIWSLAWKPDGTQLVFASNHENWCSINNADLFTIQASGSGYRRVTEAPSCQALANYAQGRVEVPVSNAGAGSFTGFVYIQGASRAQLVNLPPGGSKILTFDAVADFGAGVLQMAGFMQGSRREIAVGSAVDVAAGGTVESEGLSVWETSVYSIWEVHSPSWRYGSNHIAYVLNLNSIRQIAANPAPLDFGTRLLNVDPTAMTDFASHLAYGPTAATANQILYSGADAYSTAGIYRVTEGSSTAGELLVSYDFTQSILGLAWLPDGSGFVYSVKEYTYSPEYIQSANLFVYTFAAGKSQRLTNFSGEFSGLLSVSPDSQKVVFERGAELNTSLEVANPDLWMINLNGSGLMLFKSNGRSPVWSSGQTSLPPGSFDFQVYLPVLKK